MEGAPGERPGKPLEALKTGSLDEFPERIPGGIREEIQEYIKEETLGDIPGLILWGARVKNCERIAFGGFQEILWDLCSRNSSEPTCHSSADSVIETQRKFT